MRLLVSSQPEIFPVLSQPEQGVAGWCGIPLGGGGGLGAIVVGRSPRPERNTAGIPLPNAQRTTAFISQAQFRFLLPSRLSLRPLAARHCYSFYPLVACSSL